jgi:hypothetical protein
LARLYLASVDLPPIGSENVEVPDLVSRAEEKLVRAALLNSLGVDRYWMFINQ